MFKTKYRIYKTVDGCYRIQCKSLWTFYLWVHLNGITYGYMESAKSVIDYYKKGSSIVWEEP